MLSNSTVTALSFANKVVKVQPKVRCSSYVTVYTHLSWQVEPTYVLCKMHVCRYIHNLVKRWEYRR